MIVLSYCKLNQNKVYSWTRHAKYVNKNYKYA